MKYRQKKERKKHGTGKNRERNLERAYGTAPMGAATRRQSAIWHRVSGRRRGPWMCWVWSPAGIPTVERERYRIILPES